MRSVRLTLSLCGLLMAGGCEAKAPPAAAEPPQGVAVPEGRYRLTWRKVDSPSVNVRITTPGGPQRQPATSGTLDVEFSVRDGRLSGCLLSDTATGSAAPGNCRMRGDLLLIDVGVAERAQEGLQYELRRTSASSFSGSAVMISPFLPGGRAVFGTVQMSSQR